MKLKEFLIDTNVVITAAGQIGEAWAVVILEEVAKGKIPACTTAMNLQEILELFCFTGQRFLGQKMHRCFKEIVDRVLPVSVSDFDASYRLFKKHPAKSPRELLHAAVTMNHKVTKIFALDGPDYSDISTIQVLKLKNLLQALKLPGNYIYERTGQEG